MQVDAKVLAHFLSISQDLFCITDFEGRFVSLNPAWERVLGWRPDELVQRAYLDFVHPEDHAATIREAECLLTTGTGSPGFENRYRSKGGSYRWTLWNSVVDQNNRLVFSSAKDITVLKRTEEHLRDAQKMEAIGRLAGMLAHDLNNIFVAILSYATFIRESKGAKQHPQIVSDAQDIILAVERGSNLTRDLLALSRRQIIRPSVVDLNQWLQQLERVLARAVGDSIIVTLQLQPDVWSVTIDPARFEQVFLNLALNSRDAMPEGGTLLLETRNVIIDERDARAQYGVDPGEYVQIAVTDSGSGMPEEVRLRLFEPFFTTKPPGKGTGLGLSICHGIVKQAGGHIWVYSEPGRGTTFKIYLPRTLQEVAPRTTEQPPRTLLRRGRETVLVVEDDVLIRKACVRALSTSGYAVLDAEDGFDALRLCEHFHGQIDLLIADIVMPNLGGKELAQRLAARYPAMKVLFMSGYTDNAIVHNGVLDASVEFLEKPFSPERLLEHVARML